MRASVFLITKGDDGTERGFAEAEAAEREGCFEYSFAKDGSRFRIRTGSCAYIAREGELSYELSLDPHRDTRACIRSAYGDIFVSVHTAFLEAAQGAEGSRLCCAYELNFSGTIRKHRLTFSAKHGQER